MKTNGSLGSVRKLGVMLLLLGLAPGVSLRAQETKVTGAKLTGYGVYNEQKKGGTLAVRTSKGFINRTTSQSLVEQTDVIQAKLGRSFGITYVVEGSPNEGRVDLDIRLLHPKMKNPERKKPMTSDEHPAVTSIGESNYDGFTFENEWEIVPGKWKFQVFANGKLVLEKAFEVTK